MHSGMMSPATTLVGSLRGDFRATGKVPCRRASRSISSLIFDPESRDAHIARGRRPRELDPDIQQRVFLFAD